MQVPRLILTRPFKIPNLKHQISNKFQISISNSQNRHCIVKFGKIRLFGSFLISVIVIYLLFGICYLFFSQIINIGDTIFPKLEPNPKISG